jgi:hypothetical protein
MIGYKAYSKDIWDYLGDMPYMPTRADRDRLLANDPDRVQLWDYFFRIKPEDVGEPQKEEIREIEKCILQEISTHTQKQNEIAEAIRNNRRLLFWKKLRNFLYGGGCFALTIFIYRFVTNNKLSIDWLIGCTSPFLTSGLILWLTITIVGWNEKREIRALKAQSSFLNEQHSQSIKAKMERKKFLKSEIKELKKQIPTPPLDIDVHRWFTEHLDSVVEDSKRETGLLSSELIEIDSANPILVFGPGELQDPERFPPTFSEIRATDDINFDIKKHLTARRAVELPRVGFDVLYGMYYLECILIAKDMLATYGLFYDFITGKSHGVETTEQYYKDVVSIVITNEFRWIEKDKTQQLQTKEVYVEDAPTFMLSLASGENRTVTFVNERYFSEIKDKIDISEENISRIYLIHVSRAYANRAIKALRHQLRLHKGLDNGND